MTSGFPERVYTIDEVEKAKKLVEAGYKHKLTVKGSHPFKKQVEKILEHVKTAGFYNYLRTYIKWIIEIDGFSQLRETEVALWINTQLLKTPIEAAGFFIQKASQMKEFLEGKLYYGGAAEARSVETRINFLKALERETKDQSVRKECSRILKQWAESTFVF